MIIDRETFLDLQKLLQGMTDVTKNMARFVADSPETKQGISPYVGELMGHAATMGELLTVVAEENKATEVKTMTSGRA